MKKKAPKKPVEPSVGKPESPVVAAPTVADLHLEECMRAIDGANAALIVAVTRLQQHPNVMAFRQTVCGFKETIGDLTVTRSHLVRFVSHK